MQINKHFAIFYTHSGRVKGGGGGVGDGGGR